VTAVSIRNSIKKTVVRELLSGRASLDGGPIFCDTGHVKMYVTEEDGTLGSMEFADKLKDKLKQEKDYGTLEYIRNHISPAEIYGLSVTGIDARTILKTASYVKSLRDLASVRNSLLKYKVKCVGNAIPRGGCNLWEALKFKRKDGVLSRFPLLAFAKNGLTLRDCKDICDIAGINSTGLRTFEDYFGDDQKCLVVRGVLPYSEAANLSKIMGCQILDVFYPIHF
jgi:hypothetical protein